MRIGRRREKRKGEDGIGRIAVLIDADNVKPHSVISAIERISKLGRICLKRAYGNWSKACLAKWKPLLREAGIKAEQQTDYVVGKSATDMQLIVQAMDMLYSGNYDAFAVISSDSDMSPLLVRLRESGAYVIAAGEEKAPASMRNSADLFLTLESEEDGECVADGPSMSGDDEAVAILDGAWSELHGEDGYADLAAVNPFAMRTSPGFRLSSCGGRKWRDIVSAHPGKYRTRSVTREDGIRTTEYRKIA